MLAKLESLRFEPGPIKDLKDTLIPVVSGLLLMPGCTAHASAYASTVGLIVELALDEFWKKASDNAQSILAQMAERQDAMSAEPRELKSDVAALNTSLNQLLQFYRSTWESGFDFRKPRTLPREYSIQGKNVINPFFQTRAEDFNHNFLKLAGKS